LRLLGLSEHRDSVALLVATGLDKRASGQHPTERSLAKGRRRRLTQRDADAD